MGFLGEIKSMLSNMKQLSEGFLVIAAVPMLINCFFGYKIMKFMITLSGAAVGAVIGALLGALSGEEAFILVLAILLAVLCGFLAFKLYKLGIFLQFWLLGTLVFAALFVAMGYFEAVGFAVILGLVIGVLAVVLHKGFIIVTTAISGGMVAGVCIGTALKIPVPGCVIVGVILSIFGMVVQFALEKKPKTNPSSNSGTTPVMPMNSPGVPETGNKVLFQQIQGNEEPVKNVPSYTELSKVVPDYCCPKSKVLLESVALCKDDANTAYFTVELNNIGDDKLVAVYFKVKGYGIAGEELGEQEYSLIDLSIAPDTRYHSEAIQLFHNSIRRVEIVFTRIVNGDYAVTEFADTDTMAIPERKQIRDSINQELAELMELEADEKYLYTPLAEGVWICSCGKIGYHKCSHCGRTESQVLKNTDTDVIARITDTVRKLVERAENCKTLHEIDAQKNRLERVIEQLNENEICVELAEDCKGVLEKLTLKKREREERSKKIRRKTGKTFIIVAVCAVVLVVMGKTVKMISELPPSDKKIEADAKQYFSESFDDYYEVQEISVIEKVDLAEGYKIEVVVTAKDTRNEDVLEANLILDYYDKKNGRYINTDAYGANNYIVVPNHSITEKDEFSAPSFVLWCDDSYTNIYDSEIQELTEDGSLTLAYEIDYSNIVVAENTAEVPMTVHLEYLNSKADGKVTVSYIYSGNYSWESDTSAELQSQPKGEVLDEALLKQLMSEASVRYYDYRSGKEVELSGAYFTLQDCTLKYFHGFTWADLTGEVTWDNSLDKIDGTIEATFCYVAGQWSLEYFFFEYWSDPVRYGEVSDSALLELLTPMISDHCSETTNISNVTITNRTDNGEELKVTVEYDSENENYWLRNRVEFLLVESLPDGYAFKRMLSESVYSKGLKGEIHTAVPVNYSLRCYNALPNGMPLSGSTELQLDMDENGNASITGTIGVIALNLQGHISYPGDFIEISGFQQRVNVEYSLVFTVSSDLLFNVTPYFYYRDGGFSGGLKYESVGIGAGDFEIVFE